MFITGGIKIVNVISKVLSFFEQLTIQICYCIIKLYQYCISPLFYSKCRYYPTCSNYAIEALANFGLLKGAFLAIKRILRCNHFFKSGIDEVPKKNIRNGE